MNQTTWLNHLGVFFTLQATFGGLWNHQCGVRSAVLVLMKVGEPRERRLELRHVMIPWSTRVRGLRSANQHWGWGLCQGKNLLEFQHVQPDARNLFRQWLTSIGGVPWKKQAELRLAPTNGAGEKMSYLFINQQNVAQKPRYIPKLCLINWVPNCK